ncbi:tyrosine-type recombinase/integrase [Cytobacillus oceanisediminis]|uniref:tyrosine-type recombinase/integrase n=1 Tax=Cytobacillus oceanisediminis TaxID=665099 RepID=UPI0035CA6B3C
MPPLFVSNRGKRISVRNVQDILSRLNDRCGFKKGTVHPHVLRHSFLYQTAKKVPLTTLTQLAGHDDSKTTMIYTTPNLQKSGRNSMTCTRKMTERIKRANFNTKSRMSPKMRKSPAFHF